MAIDPYTLCPCGSGKKLKFCCSDVIADIDKIHRMIEGDQPRAALRHVEQTLASHPDRASLLDLKTAIELSLEDLDSARATAEHFVSTHPDSPTALACQALLLAETGEARAAAGALQRALAAVDREMPQRVFEAIGAVGGALLTAGHVLAAQAHLWLHAAIAPRDDMRAYEAIVELNHYSGMPLLLRDQLHLSPWPDDVPWKNEAQQASRLADSGKWQQAVAIIDRLGQSYGADPTLVFNRALLGGWLVDDRALVAGLHAYAQLDVPLDDAIEAEAIAQLLDPELKEEPVETVKQVYLVHDEDLLVSQIAADRRVERLAISPEDFAQSDEPPPRFVAALFDRPLLETGADIAREEVPRLAAILALFGRQTDRAERLEITLDRGPACDDTIRALREIGGGALGELTEEAVIGSNSPTEKALNVRWRLPRGMPPDARQRLLDEERRTAITQRWPELRRPALGGKTPREAAGVPELRIPLMASLMLLEQGSNSDRDSDAIAQLRRELGLPQPEPIDPGGKSVAAIPLVRIPRLQLEAVADDDLVHLYRRAVMAGAQVAITRTAREAVRRPQLSNRISTGDAYRQLVAAERDTERALALVDEARTATRSAGQSVAAWDLAELELYVASGDAQRAKDSLARIQRDHAGDPEVAAAVYRLLYQLGLIRPDSAPLAAAPEDEVPIEAVGSAVGPPANRIWTPDSDRPSGGKSTLWTPS